MLLRRLFIYLFIVISLFIIIFSTFHEIKQIFIYDISGGKHMYIHRKTIYELKSMCILPIFLVFIYNIISILIHAGILYVKRKYTLKIQWK